MRETQHPAWGPEPSLGEGCNAQCTASAQLARGGGERGRWVPRMVSEEGRAGGAGAAAEGGERLEV